jgi:DNA-damage-inducible protein D
MKKELIIELFRKFEAARQVKTGVEYWSARDMQHILGYSQWRNFTQVIEKAKTACNAAEIEVKDHFADISKMVEIGSGVSRELDDLALTRYACYLVAQNGDASKPEIAFAQTYFAVQTRKQEIIEQRLLDIARVSAREKLTKSEKKLSGILYERGVDEKGFAVIRSKGDQVLFGGFTTQMMKTKLGAPENKPLADHLSTLAIKAKDFANELTSHNTVEKDLRGVQPIESEHVANNRAVRKMLAERGVKPENLPPGEDVQKVRRRLAADDKNLVKEVKKKRK